MNLIELTVTAENDRFILAGSGLCLALAQRRFPDLGRHVGQQVTVGMRPQHLRLGAALNDNQIGLRGTLLVSEQLGDEQLFAMRVGDREIRIAGIDPDLTVNTGAQIEAAIAMDNLHVFAGSMDERIA